MNSYLQVAREASQIATGTCYRGDQALLTARPAHGARPRRSAIVVRPVGDAHLAAG